MSRPKFEPAPLEFKSKALSLDPTCTGIYSEIVKEVSGYFHIDLTRVSFVSLQWLNIFDLEGVFALTKDPFGM